MEAKILEFGNSISIPKNQPRIYMPEADVYSFGVLMCELLCGMLANKKRSLKDVQPQFLMNLFRRYYDNEPEILVDPFIKDQVDSQSLHAFIDLAHACVSLDIRERPSINRIIKRIQTLMNFQNPTITTIQSHQNQKLEEFQIPLEDIKKALGGDFTSKTPVGAGGFGDMYEGQLSERWNKRKVAIKRLKSSEYNGIGNFLNELKLIFWFQHENIIPFFGYCIQDNEMIIVTEYAINGSLDCYLEDEQKRGLLTWTQRLKICLGAARGINHLHTGHGKGNTLIHRDVKSANILLDDKLEAKICDFGLSKLDLKNQSHTGIYTKLAGTQHYVDPIYQESGKVRTKSDVYSFGVVMFEMMTGMLAHEYKKIGDGKLQLLISLVRRYYDAGEVEMLMDDYIKDQPYDKDSFRVFVHTAFECINMNYKERPNMRIVIERIEKALAYQASMSDV